jgi:cytochrome c-type biogenesis protein CcsB
MIVLLAVYAFGLAMATFVEKTYGTLMAKVLIYYSPLFFLLQFLLAVNFMLILFKYRLYTSGKRGFLTVHLSLIVILLGAFISHLTGKEGVLHLRTGEKGNQIVMHTNHGQKKHSLPFEIELVRFTLKRYPGSMSPSSYESELLVYADGDVRSEKVYMNNVLDVKGYRFFQASFDKDEQGTILAVNKDVAGRNVTYTGYLLLLIGAILCLTSKKGRLRTLYSRIKKTTAMSVMLPAALMSLFPACLYAQGTTADVTAEDIQQIQLSPAHAEKFGMLPVQSVNGRIIPVNTFSSEILRKLHKDTRFGALNSDQFLLSILAFPEMWRKIPFIVIPNKDIAVYLGISDGRCAYQHVFDADGRYRLQAKLEQAYMKMPDKRTAFDKDLIKLDEKINIFHQLIHYQLIHLFPKPDDPDQKWYAPGDNLSGYRGEDSVFVAAIFHHYLADVRNAVQSGNWNPADEMLDMIAAYQYRRNTIPELKADRIALEVKYNRLDIFRWCKIGYLSLGGLLLTASFMLFFSNDGRIRYLLRVMALFVILLFLFQMLGIAMRWMIGGYAPWSNSYETMVYAAWATVCAGLIFARRSPVTFSLATLFAGIILFVSGLSWMDPQINPLVPVLKSPWLMFHVAMIMSAYGFFGIGFLIGLTNLVMMSIIRKDKLNSYYKPLCELSIINEISLIAGLLLMTIGTFMGAVWANESWGRYWGWDPKETWALITVITYAMVTHLHLVKKWNNLWLFNLASVTAFASVLMTYWGVNFLLSGMHSYGQHDHMQGLFACLYIIAGWVVLLAFLSGKGRALKYNINK